MEQMVISVASLGGIGIGAASACLIASSRSVLHPAFAWWFLRLGLVPAMCSAFAIYIGLTPRGSIEGSAANFGRLDFVAILFWGLLVPVAYLIMASMVLLVRGMMQRKVN